jgi:hypothetical protein
MTKRLDQEELRDYRAALESEAASLQSALKAAGQNYPPQPTPKHLDDDLESVDCLEAGIASLRIVAKVFSVDVNGIKPAAVPGESTLHTQSSQSSQGTQSSQGDKDKAAKAMTATEKVLAANGVKSIKELAAKKQIERNLLFGKTIASRINKKKS